MNTTAFITKERLIPNNMFGMALHRINIYKVTFGIQIDSDTQIYDSTITSNLSETTLSTFFSSLTRVFATYTDHQTPLNHRCLQALKAKLGTELYERTSGYAGSSPPLGVRTRTCWWRQTIFTSNASNPSQRSHITLTSQSGSTRSKTSHHRFSRYSLDTHR